MPEELKSMLDAVSGAIDGAATQPEPAKQEVVSDDTAADTEVDAAGGDDTESETGEGDAGTVGDADSAGDGADPKAGKDAAGDSGAEAGKDGAADAQGAAAEAEKKAAAKPVDPVNDPIPPTVSERTRERITSLIGTVKQQGLQLEQANVLFDSIADTGMEPDELASMLTYARARHHGTVEDRKAAYGFLKSELKALAIELGETDSVDFLAEHPDLQAAVEANQMTAEYAKEMALHRERNKRTTASTEATRTQDQQRAAHAAGTQALNTLGSQLAKRDKATFAAKHRILMATLGPKKDAAGRITDPGVLARFPPNQWATVYQNAYEALPTPAAPSPTPTPPAKVTPSPTPLRPGTPAGGGGKREPKSMADAISAAIDGVDD